MTNWTPQQQAAINSGGRNILVSAAAGSGKTSVLCERIMRQLTEGSELSRMLVVTFTRAAAASLQEKLRKSLRAAMLADPQNRHLARQYLALPHARIGTIHSFCLDIVRENFAALALPPKVRMMDEVEEEAFSRTVLEKVTQEFYLSDDQSTLALFDQLTVHSEETLENTLLSLYSSALSQQGGLGAVLQTATAMTSVNADNLFSTPYGRVIRENFAGILRHYHKVYNTAIEHFEDCEHLWKSHGEAFPYDLELIENLLVDLEHGRDYSAVIARLDLFVPQKLKPLKAELKDEICEFFREQRLDFHKYILRDKPENKTKKSKRGKIGLDFSSAQFTKDSRQSADLLATLHRVLVAFDTALLAEKRQRGVVDFGDLERFTYELLVKDHTPTKIAAAVAVGFDHIYVDEYQDTNYTQDAIFRAIGRDNVFMVGDVKQSIYGFRGARPDIFSGYRDRYSTHSGGEGEKIFLSDNFRSAHPVIRTCNAIFSRLLPFSAAIGYVPEDDLNPKSNRPENTPVQLHICPYEMEEGAVVARLVEQHITSGVKPHEIAILMRSPKNTAPAIISALTALDIPVGTGEELDFWEREEICVLRCLLETADNPASDVYTAGALRSPKFGLRVEDLAAIREAHDGANLYENLQAYAITGNTHLHQTVQAFLAFMELTRREGATLPLAQQVHNLVTATFGGTALWDSEDLLQFFGIVRQYEANTAAPDLSGLLRHIHKLTRGKRNRKNEPSKTGVNIMSTHASKGLEFPVVILCGMGRKIGGGNTSSEIAHHGTLGFAPRLPDEQLISRRDSIFGVTAAILGRRDDIEEEVRNLYVALTRAESTLILVGKTSAPGGHTVLPETLIDKSRVNKNFLSPYQLDNCDTFLSWVLMTLPPLKEGTDYTIHIATPTEEATDEPTEAPSLPTTAQPALSESDRRTAEERLNFVYPWQHLTTLPSKLSVSRLYPGILDESEESTPFQTAANYRTPLFMQSAPVEETARLAGLATHAFMQFCDFAQVARNGVQLELHRLTAARFISPQVAQRVEIQRLEAFFASPLYAEMQSAPQLFRERRFNVRLPAAEFATDPKNIAALAEETILVQGVVDCYFVDAGGRIHLVDYKTDRFPATMPHDAVAKELRRRHSLQLGYYRRALENLTGQEVARTIIYSFHLGAGVEYPPYQGGTDCR